MRRPLAVLAALVLGLGLAACSDDGDDPEQAAGRGPITAEGPELDEHWHVAYEITACGETLAPAEDRGADVYGIHTHGDGLIHTHPFAAQAAGAEATLGVFLDQIGAELTDDGLQLVAADAPEGCTGPVRVGQWDDAADAADGAEPDRVIDTDIADIVLAPDLSALSIVIGPEDDPIPAPSSAADICEMAAADGPVDPATAEERC